MKKASLLILSILLLLITGNVYAEGTGYGVFIGNTEFTADRLTIPGTTGGTATYNPDTKTLTLKDFKYEGVLNEEISNQMNAIYEGIIIREENVKIIIEGNNKISFPDLGYSGAGQREPYNEAALVIPGKMAYGIVSVYDIDKYYDIIDYDNEDMSIIKQQEKEAYEAMPNTIIGGTGTLDIEFGTADMCGGISGDSKLTFQDGVNINIYQREASTKADMRAFGINGVGVIIENANININFAKNYNEGIVYSPKFEMDNGSYVFNGEGAYNNGIEIGFGFVEYVEANINGGKIKISYAGMYNKGFNANLLTINGGELEIINNSEKLIEVERPDMVYSRSWSVTSLPTKVTMGLYVRDLVINGGSIYMKSNNKMSLMAFENTNEIRNNKLFQYRYQAEAEMENIVELNDQVLDGVELRLESYSYKVVEGDKQTLDDESDNYSLVIDGDPSKFVKLSIDDVEFVLNTDYSLDGDKIVFSTDGLNKIKQLPKETHSVSMVYSDHGIDNVVNATFTLGSEEEKINNDEINPQTFDNVFIYVFILLVSTFGLSFIIKKAQ